MTRKEVQDFLRTAQLPDGSTLSANRRMAAAFTRANASRIWADRRADLAERIDTCFCWAAIALLLGCIAFWTGYVVGLVQTALGY